MRDTASVFALAAAAGVRVEQLEELLARYPDRFPRPVRVIHAPTYPRRETLAAIQEFLRARSSVPPVPPPEVIA